MVTAPQSLQDQPFETFRLPWWARGLVQLCHRMPTGGLGKKLVFLLRKPVIRWCAEPMDVSVGGLRCRLYPSQNLSDKRLLTTPYLLDGAEREFLKQRLAAEAVVLDVGANVGGYSLLLLRERPDLKVLAVEAEPGLAERLADNLRLSGFSDRCDVHQGAITDQPGTVRLIQDAQNQGQNSLASEAVAATGDNSIAVEGRPMLDVMDARHIERPALLKMDIEGYEPPVLRAFFAAAARSRWPLYIQVEQYRKEALNEAVNLCLEQGYTIQLRTRMNVILQRPAHPAFESAVPASTDSGPSSSLPTARSANAVSNATDSLVGAPIIADLSRSF